MISPRKDSLMISLQERGGGARKLLQPPRYHAQPFCRFLFYRELFAWRGPAALIDTVCQTCFQALFFFPFVSYLALCCYTATVSGSSRRQVQLGSAVMQKIYIYLRVPLYFTSLMFSVMKYCHGLPSSAVQIWFDLDWFDILMVCNVQQQNPARYWWIEDVSWEIFI